jgi:O-acetyl-ADP-ribose deacetylase (regulator of RNase III)
MIYEVEGDILKSKAKVIAHGVAPSDDFKNGLALSLRENWPALYKDFRHWCHTQSPKSGSIWSWAGSDGRQIVNLMTQEPAPSNNGHPGKATTHNVNECLRELKHWIEKEKPASVAIPKLATGVGGLNWDEVKPIIETQLGDLDLPIYIYTLYKKDLEAQEPS